MGKLDCTTSDLQVLINDLKTSRCEGKSLSQRMIDLETITMQMSNIISQLGSGEIIMPNPTVSMTATETVATMGSGWCLGNTLDALDTNLLAYEQRVPATQSQYKDKYQMMATYSTESYTGWDASTVYNFSESTGVGTLSWNMASLNSTLSAPCGAICLQIINHDIQNTGSDTLGFTINSAQFTKANNTVVSLTSFLGNYSKVIANGVVEYVACSIVDSTQLLTTADMVGGTLSISVTITSYPFPVVSTSVTSITKEAFYETRYGNPVTTKYMIDEVKAKGFKSVRIPVTYYNHMDSSGTIDATWLARVAQVVNYVLNNNMHCIINVHHDTGEQGWLRAELSTISTSGTKFATMWTQIANYFKDYDYKLIFEGYNELLNSENQWTWAGEDSYSAANQLNQKFVTAVRATGGKNSDRCLVVNTYAANAENVSLVNFVFPTDTISNKLIAQCHFYGAVTSWIDSIFSYMNTYFVSKGIPAIIGEYGMSFTDHTETQRIEYVTYLTNKANVYGIKLFWWDDGHYEPIVGHKCNYALLDRIALTWHYPSLANAIVSLGN